MDNVIDGSLCRLTRSFSNVECNMKIVPVSEEERKSTGLDYKLVWIGEKESDCESASEKSDEDLSSWTLENLDIELGISKTEKAEDKTKEVIAEKLHNKDTGNKQFNRRFRSNNTNRHRKNYVSPGPRNSKFYNNGNKSYNRQKNNTDSNDINPWLVDPVKMFSSLENNQFGNYPQFQNMLPVVIDSSMNTPVSSNIDPPKPRSRGILGNSPFDRCQPNFQTANANHFSNNANYWNGEYSDNYQRPVQNVPMSANRPYKKHHNPKYWKNEPKSYNRNQPRNQDKSRVSNRNQMRDRQRGRGGRRFNNYRQ